MLGCCGLFDRPATADALAALWKGEAIAGLTEPLIGIGEAERNLALQRLEDAKLLTVNRQKVPACSSRSMRILSCANTSVSACAVAAEAWRAAHRRLYEHLCANHQGQARATLEDLQPLYQAVAHGCHAGLQQEACDKVYIGRICASEKPTARGNSARSVPTWEPSPASSRLRGAASRPRSRKPIRPGC